MTRFDELRAEHPCFTYEDYAIERTRDDLKFTFSFTMAPDLAFAPTTTLRAADPRRLAGLPRETLDALAFHLGLIELLSYWKTACAPEIVIKAGALDAAQVAWWTDLILHGMREFFFVNGIDFRRADLFTLVTVARAGRATGRFDDALPADEDLVLVSGGKDSAFTLEFLREAGHRVRGLFLNPTPAARDVARVAGCTDAVVVERTLDPAMLDLTIEPDDRPSGGFDSHPRPDIQNYAQGGFAHYLTARAWLSTWSGLSSNATMVKRLTEVAVPTLFVHYAADIFTRLSELAEMEAACAAADKTVAIIRHTDHYGRRVAPDGSLGERVLDGTRAVSDWIQERFPA